MNDINKLIEKAVKITKTKTELSKRIGVHWTSIFRWLSGTHTPSLESYFKIKQIVEKGETISEKRKSKR